MFAHHGACLLDNNHSLQLLTPPLLAMHMDHHHPPYSSVRTNHLFASHQLPPPPVQLPAINLIPQRPSVTTLPPMAAMDSSPYRHSSPVSWGPSSSSSIHRTSNSREDVTMHSHSQRELRPMKREPTQQIHNIPPPQPPLQIKEQDDTMPATSDFVKKLYKSVFCPLFSRLSFISSL